MLETYSDEKIKSIEKIKPQALFILDAVFSLWHTGINSIGDNMLSYSFNRFVIQQATLYCPKGYDVRPVAPATLSDATRYYVEHGRLCVWSGASEKTIFGDACINHAFRAWHDWHHVMSGQEFDRIGEYQVMLAQIRDAFNVGPEFPLFALLIECEVIGQFDYCDAHGVFPTDQEAFARDWLRLRGVNV